MLLWDFAWKRTRVIPSVTKSLVFRKQLEWLQESIGQALFSGIGQTGAHSRNGLPSKALSSESKRSRRAVALGSLA